MPQSQVYNVRVFFLGVPAVPEPGTVYGPFESRQTAEQCLIALASRADVRSAIIEKIEVN